MSSSRTMRVSQRRFSVSAARRGFTLVELMAVVVIVGILATLAIFSLRRYVFAARSSEATEMIGLIKAAQENFKDETFRYLDVSGGDLTAYYPSPTPGSFKTGWGDTSTPLGQNWAQLGVAPSGPVVFGYACVAGQGGTPPSTALSDDVDWPETAGPWYVVQAVADQNGNGVFAVYVSSSFSDQIFFEHEDE